MAKRNQNNKSPQKVCEKLRNAINFSLLRRSHRASSHQQSHLAPTPPMLTTNNPIKGQVSTNNPIKGQVSQPSPVQLIPIETTAQGGGQKSETTTKVNISSVMSNNKLMVPAKEKRTHVRNSGGVQENNEVFSEYITRVRNGMRTSSDLGIERIPTKKISRRDSLNDRVSNFLNLAKIRNKASSSVGHDMHGNQSDY